MLSLFFLLKQHSYPPSYFLSPRDGWQSVSASDLPYKYANSTTTKPPALLQLQERSPLTNEGIDDHRHQQQGLLSLQDEEEEEEKKAGFTGKTMQKIAKKPKKSKKKKGGKKLTTDSGDVVDSTKNVVDDSTSGILGGVVDNVMTAIGKAQEVIITW